MQQVWMSPRVMLLVLGALGVVGLAAVVGLIVAIMVFAKR